VKYASPVFDTSTPINTWVDLDVTQQIVPAGGSTNKLHAPPGTKRIRFEVTFFQTLYDWGSIYFDDAQLQEVVLQPTTLVASLNGENIDLSFATDSLMKYRLWYKDSVAEPSWTLLTTVVGNGLVQTVSDPLGPGLRLYAVETIH